MGTAALAADPKANSASSKLRTLKRQAALGGKQAQLELGSRYERGDGVPRDLSRAARLFAAAGTNTSGSRMMFVPQRNGSVSAVPAAEGLAIPALPAAREQLLRLCTDEVVKAPSCSQVLGDRQQTSAVKDEEPEVVAQGKVMFLAQSDFCKVEKQTIRKRVPYNVASCSVNRYELASRGKRVVLYDLYIVIDDVDAIDGVPVPFCLFDRVETDLSLPNDKPVKGTAKYTKTKTSRGNANILTSFIRRP